MSESAGIGSRQRWMLASAAIILLADQVSKIIVRRTLELGMPSRPDVFFQFTRHKNTGIMGGAFSDHQWVAWIAPIFALGVLVYLYKQLEPESRAQFVALGMVIGGAIGNIIDRLHNGGVTDFFQFHFMFLPDGFPWKYYPAFNIADSGIVVGIVLLLLTWRGPKDEDVSGTA